MKDYKVVMANAISREEAVKQLNEEVNKLVGNDWKPVGGVVVDPVVGSVVGSIYLYQTLIKE